MKLGKKALEALQAEIDGRLMPGDELIVAGPVAAEGTAWINLNLVCISTTTVFR